MVNRVVLLLSVVLLFWAHPVRANHVSWGHSPRADSVPQEASGTFSLLPGTGPIQGDGDVHSFYLETETGIGTTGDTFERFVTRALFSPRGWSGADSIAVRRVGTRTGDVGITLATPTTVNALCEPLRTNGIYSCWNGERAVINLWRWHAGDKGFDRIRTYRLYLINHEVGHALGYEHEPCPGSGERAPLMQQQSKQLNGCRPNPWPYPDRRHGDRRERPS